MTPRLWLEMAVFLVIVAVVGVIVTRIPRPGITAAVHADSAAVTATAHYHAAHDRVAPETVRAVIRDRSADRWRDSLRVVLDSLDAARARHDTVRVGVLTTDAITLTPTVVAAEDTARAACTMARRTCAAALDSADAALRALAVARDRWQAAAQHRPWLACGPGLAVTPQGAGLAVACTYPLLLR